MDAMRWILLGAGLAVIAGIYLFSRLQAGFRQRRRQREALKGRRRDPLYSGSDVPLGEQPRKTGRSTDDGMQDFDEPLVIEASDTGSSFNGKVISLTVNAPAGVPFRGVVLHGALRDAGLVFGDMDIFHCMEDRRGRSEILFSVANIREPGTLVPDDFEDFTTDGIVLFMQVPGPSDAAHAFDEMVGAARKLADSLDAIVRDSTNSVLSNQTIRHMREEVISLQLQQQVTRNAS